MATAVKQASGAEKPVAGAEKPIAGAEKPVAGAEKPEAGAERGSHRIEWLDGVRGLAALFVVLHHTWLSAWPHFPRNLGPSWVGWLLYGHLAVSVFIIVSGFSLALAPLSRGDRLNGGIKHFLNRRSWRIIPPYWAALVFSLLITAVILPNPYDTAQWLKAFVVHDLLIQDIVGSPVPNGTFWSIAVEFQIYLVFPLMLVVARRANVRVAVAATVAVVLIAHGVAGLGSPFNKINHLTPQYLALFALGMLAVDIGRSHAAHDGRNTKPMLMLAAVMLAAFVALTYIEGSVWIVGNYFWIDLGFGIAMALVIMAMYSGGARLLRRTLATRPVRGLGRFSYSIYLIHGPLLALAFSEIVLPLHLSPVAGFLLAVFVLVPCILVVCYAFHLVFEAPFLHKRSMAALREVPGLGQLLAFTSRRSARIAEPDAPELVPETQAP